MSQSIPKPLPDVPASLVLRRLTVESNALIRTFIQCMVDKEGLDSSWTNVIKGALADLGECVESGQWLPGFKMTQTARNRANVREETRMHEQARKERDRLRNVKAAKGKGSDKLKKGDGEIHDVQASTPRSEEETRRLKLKEICTLISTPALPASTLSPKHLLLTIAPHTATLPERDLDFDIIPTSKGCRFQVDAYSLPFFEEGLGKGGKGGIIICGLDTWGRACVTLNPSLSLNILGSRGPRSNPTDRRWHFQFPEYPFSQCLRLFGQCTPTSRLHLLIAVSRTALVIRLSYCPTISNTPATFPSSHATSHTYHWPCKLSSKAGTLYQGSVWHLVIPVEADRGDHTPRGRCRYRRH